MGTRANLLALAALTLSSGVAATTPPRIVRDIQNEAVREAPSEVLEIDGVLYLAMSRSDLGAELWRSDGTVAGTRLIADLDPCGDTRNPRSFVAMDGILYFILDGEGWREEQLWRSDGTGPGTWMVAEIDGGAALDDLTPVGDQLFLVADGAAGRELWVSDGTPAGTRLVRDINPGADGASPSGLSVLNGVLHFTAFEPATGRELWRTDGSVAGTYRASDVAPGADGFVSNIEVLGDGLVLAADDGINGRELWISDGTARGTQLLRDIHPTDSSRAELLAATDSLVFFTAYNGIHGKELWATDGSDAWRVSDVKEGLSNSYFAGLTAVGERVFFVSETVAEGRELWTSDGTLAGTRMTRDIRPGSVNGVLGTSFVAGADVLHFLVGSDPWISDGTEAGTRLVVETGLRRAWPLTFAMGRQLFRGEYDVGGWELWWSDGTAAGTQAVPLLDATYSSLPRDLARVGDRVLFGARDTSSGHEPWISDGTATGTVRLADIGPDRDGWRGPAVAVGPVAYFGATTSGPLELWRTDGTPAGTTLVAEIPRFHAPLPHLDGVVFQGYQGLWRSDGTASGTLELSPQAITRIAVSGELIYFVSGAKLWVSDGSITGTRLLLTAASIQTFEEVAAAGDNRLLLSVHHDDVRWGEWDELWAVDGARETFDELPVVLSATPSFARRDDGLLFFAGRTAAAGIELWVSDATLAGTRLVDDVESGTASSYPRSATVVGDRVFYRGRGDGAGSELRVINAEATTSTLVADLAPGPENGEVSWLLAVGERLFFRLRTDDTGWEAWVSDGTTFGTFALGEATPGPCGLATFGEIVIGEQVYFVHEDRHGDELWVYDLPPSAPGIDLLRGPRLPLDPLDDLVLSDVMSGDLDAPPVAPLLFYELSVDVTLYLAPAAGDAVRVGF